MWLLILIAFIQFLPSIIILFLAKKYLVIFRYRHYIILLITFIYYLMLFIAYNNAADYHHNKHHCGLWTIFYLYLGITGLLIPVFYLFANILFNRYFTKTKELYQ